MGYHRFKKRGTCNVECSLAEKNSHKDCVEYGGKGENERVVKERREKRKENEQVFSRLSLSGEEAGKEGRMSERKERRHGY